MSKLIAEMNMPEHGECDAAIMSKYGSVCLIEKMGCAYPITYVRPKDCPIKGELVLCGKCYYKDEKRIMDEDALWCRKHHMYVTADWFCADGARKIEAGVYVNGEVAFINGGPEDENEFALDETEDVDK